MLLRQTRQDRRDAAAAEQHRHRHAEPACRLAAAGVEHGLAGAQLVQRAQAAFIERLPVLGQALAARGAMEQPDAEPPLQTRDRLADRRARKAEPRRSGRETAGLTVSTKMLIPVSRSICLVVARLATILGVLIANGALEATLSRPI